MADEVESLIFQSVGLPKVLYESLQHLAFVCNVPEDNLVRAMLYAGFDKLANRCRHFPVDRTYSSRQDQARFAEEIKGILVDEFGIDGSMPDEERRIKSELDRLEQAFERDGY